MVEHSYLTELKSLRRWMTRKGKIPSNRYGYYASCTDERNFLAFNEAIACIGRNGIDGVGFVTDENHPCFDYDDALDDHGNVVTQSARDGLDTLGSRAYWEISKSGHGLHGFIQANIPYSVKRSKDKIEIYSIKPHFIAMTFNQLEVISPGSDEGPLMIWNKYTEQCKPSQLTDRGSAAPAQGLDYLSVVLKCSKNPKFADLNKGDWQKYYSSPSEADAAFCEVVAFWSDRDYTTINIMYRSSGLMREKWERDDYRDLTIKKACGWCEESYSEYVERKRRERREILAKAWR